MESLDGSVILLSGGVDSTVCLHLEIYKERGPIHALFIDYGQRHIIELESAKDIAEPADAFVIDRVSSDTLGRYSPLIQGGKVTARNAEVRGRNSMFLVIACAYAAEHNLHNVIIGCTKEDYRDFPDCRPKYLQSMERSMILGMDHNMKIQAPLLDLEKWEVVELARSLGKECWDAVGKSWSCYTPDNRAPCGICPACIRRQKAFRRIGANVR